MGTYSLITNTVTPSQQRHTKKGEPVLGSPFVPVWVTLHWRPPYWPTVGRWALFHWVSSPVSLPRWPSSPSTGKIPSSWDLLSLLSLTPGFPKIPPFLVLLSFGPIVYPLAGWWPKAWHPEAWRWGRRKGKGSSFHTAGVTVLWASPSVFQCACQTLDTKQERE